MSETDTNAAEEEQADEQATESNEVVVDAIIDAGTLSQLVETYTAFVHEGRLHFDEDGIHAKMVDPANVAMAFTDCSVDAFEAYSAGRVTIGVDFNRFEEALSVADADDLVHLTVDMETRKCHLEIGNVDQTLRLIDPDAIRKEPDLPDLDLPNSVTVDVAELDTARTVADMVSEHLAIDGDPEAEEVRFVAEGDIEDSTVTLGRDEVIDAKVVEETRSLYSLDYVTDFCKPIPTGAEVTIRFGDEFPMVWEWEASDGHQQTTAMIAPRIQSN